MHTLTIAEIFSNLSFYQDNYLSIIQDPQCYQTAVEDAYIQVWPVGTQALYLGDLLQLWFSDKWLINSPCQLLLDSYSNGRKQPLQRDHDLYLYQLNGSALSGRNNSKVWSVSEQKKLSISLDSVFKYLCIYKGISRPEVSLSALTKSFKSAV
ncbi:hypothetical protein [Acinetobacter sp. SA01]|uniref:hypothetical protein n=1 Tax=Acinetobacter sp. SA01 TaxID=1862567 RepID=UPI00140D7A78|nr:hypothetical protein [Acinetobacter sp. SA01]